MAMEPLFEVTKGMREDITTYCPGCTHGIAHRLIMEALEERGALGKAIGVSPVGCSIVAHQYMNVDMVESAHGRAPAVASGIKRVHPNHYVFTYQGDGDLASIGTGEIVHAAHRGEKICTYFINNAIFGMTGGQMAPTTLPGQVTTTSPYGRDRKIQGNPIRVCEMLSTLDGTALAARVSVDNPKAIMNAKKMIRKAFDNQLAGRGFSIVEVLSTCPTNWGMTPRDALQWLRDNMIPYYPLGVYKDRSAEKEGEQ